MIKIYVVLIFEVSISLYNDINFSFVMNHKILFNKFIVSFDKTNKLQNDIIG